MDILEEYTDGTCAVDVERRKERELMNWQDERNEAMEAIEQNTDELWKLKARTALVQLAQCKTSFTSAELSDELKDEPVHDLRALGPIMAWGAKKGYIKSTGQYLPHPYRHGSPMLLWKSLIHREWASPSIMLAQREVAQVV